MQRASNFGDELFVGVSSDELNFSKKGRYPLFNEKERACILSSLKCVNSVFLEEALELKREYLLRYEADIFIMGDDWQGKFDDLKDICEIIYLPRTKNISTSELLQRIKNDF
ncbi:TPA: glycerol-3-phosphate cytidylyltransferase [Campylobacter jejuni]|nr:glycerol-3-phosphate cytidylyltransferase [Campylobacter jejuni]HDZ5134102.1 glycerol-3-phosphate cytidylyltransferase [Campylobacter jejuni]HDZ5153953.1 glycerol-3-phosphate cytidylyltransferase [Campylobacter jejuni]HDZ5156636.1 glycerol-3-phosphate cytidylyltransferase [Campylobacter jejuni]